MKKVKRFIKEVKRIRWPSAKDTNKTFITSLLFISISALILFGIAILFTTIWNSMGVGLNG